MAQKQTAPSQSTAGKAAQAVAAVMKQPTAVTPARNTTLTPMETLMSKNQNANSNSQFFMLSAEEFAQITKQNSDAMMRSLQTWTTGMNQISQACAQFSQNMMQMSMAACQAASSARTLRDVAELQSDYAKTSMDAIVENSTKITEMTMKIANDAAQPLNQRANETMQQFNQRAA